MKDRNSNFDLLKIIAMFFIVVYHILFVNTMMLNPSNSLLEFKILSLLCFIIIVHVNLFVMITGYYQSNRETNYKKILYLYLVCVFYSFSSKLVGYYLNLGEINIYDFISSFFPSVVGDYWFIACYIIMYLFVPYINILIKSIDKKQFQRLLILCFTIFSLVPFFTGMKIITNTGYTFFHFIYLYLVGAYLKHYPIKLNKIRSINKKRILYFISFLVFGLINYMLNMFTIYSNSSNLFMTNIISLLQNSYYSYARPFVILQTISLFLLFETFTIKSKIITTISKATLGVYLISTSGYFSKLFYKYTTIDIYHVGLIEKLKYIFAGAVFIFIICIVVELLRIYILKIARNIIMKIKCKVKKNNNKKRCIK